MLKFSILGGIKFVGIETLPEYPETSGNSKRGYNLVTQEKIIFEVEEIGIIFGI
jgi:hypothetical protein